MFRHAIMAALGLVRRFTGRRGTPPPSILPALDTRPKPMRPLRPPAAVNDNPLAGLEAELERDLRANGYLTDPSRTERGRKG